MNQSVRYAKHQLAIPIGIVAASAHHSGKAMSAISPNTVNVAQKIFFCTPPFYPCVSLTSRAAKTEVPHATLRQRRQQLRQPVVTHSRAMLHSSFQRSIASRL